jgi:ABC-type transporter Mla MlaB component
MFRVTATSTSDGFVLKLEGWLSGAVVHELESCWRRAMTVHEGLRMSIDLSDLHFVDSAGRQLLTDMYRTGVTFVAKGCEMPELVREIADGSDAGRNGRAFSSH